jgi:hypothetical protein
MLPTFGLLGVVEVQQLLADKASGKLRGFFESSLSGLGRQSTVGLVFMVGAFVAVFILVGIFATIDKGLLVVISVDKVFFSNVGRTDFSNLSLRDFLGAGCHWKEGRMRDK